MNELVERVNKLLLAGEPGNITKADTNGYVGYEPQSLIDAMNEGFGLGNWGFEELSSETVDNEKGTLAVAQVRVWLKDIDFKPFSWGQSRVTRGDIGDAKKGAQTDAIKKALSYFSIGNRAYHGLLDKKSQPPVQKSKDQDLHKLTQGGSYELHHGDGQETPAKKISRLLDTHYGTDKQRRFQALREALNIGEGPLPKLEEYTNDDAFRVELYVDSQRAAKAGK